MHFDYLYVGESGPQASQGLPEDGGFRYILVIMDDLSNFVLMEPVEVCTAEVTAASLLTWCKTLGVPRVWVSCLLYTSPSPRDKRQSRMPSSA